MCGSSNLTIAESFAQLPSPLVAGAFLLLLGARRKTTRVAVGFHYDSSTCRECGYSLDGLNTRTRCPECGQPDARRRHHSRSTEVRLYVLWRPTIAYAFVAASIVLASALRIEIWEWRVGQRLGRPGMSLNYDASETLGWANVPLLLGAALIWISVPLRRWLWPRAAAIGGAALITTIVTQWAQTPSLLRLELQTDPQRQVLLAMLGAAAAGIAPALLATGVERWRGLDTPRVRVGSVPEETVHPERA